MFRVKVQLPDDDNDYDLVTRHLPRAGDMVDLTGGRLY